MAAWLVAPAPARAGGAEASAEAGADGEEIADLREILTEREDKRRPSQPFSVDVFGRPLTLGGQYEIFLFYFDQIEFGAPPLGAGRLLLEQELELEAFYSLGPPLSLFAQVRLGMEKDLLRSTPDRVSKYFVERGEMWLHSEDVLLPGLSFDVGRLNYEDDRRWWWDADLDAVRMGYEIGSFEIEASAAFEVAASQSELGFVDPENDHVIRFLGEASWDFADDQSVELFAVHQHDGSDSERLGDSVDRDREDESDADLTWLGVRLSGAWESDRRGILGYWIDSAYVFGDETVVEYEPVPGAGSEVVDIFDRRVRGWGLDLGVTWIAPAPLEPRFTLAYAIGSGDRDPTGGTDRSFRQTTLQGNETGLGGVRSFPIYGAYLFPELSNLQIVTAGIGISLFQASSLDLVYHHYRQVEPSDFLRDSNFDAELTGNDRDIGHEVDLVLAIQELSWLELDFILSGFRSGDAFGPDSGEWAFGSVVGLTLVF